MPAKRSSPKRDVHFTHTDKLMFPEAGLTKGDLLDYYDKASTALLPYLKDRPITLERLPDGVGEGKPHFWQKNTPDYYPEWIGRVPRKNEQGKTVHYALVNDKAALLYLVNQGAVTLHPYFSTVKDLSRPTFVLFDIDPHQSTFADAVTVTKALHKLLEAEKVQPLVKTTGKTGLHVMTPWRRRGGFDEARAWALKLAEQLVAEMPDVATVERNIKERGRRVYVDVMQNAEGKHAVPPWVVRTTPTATVSTPVDWSELNARLDPKKFTIGTVLKRL